MNKIKGLIIKDLLELKSYKKNFLLSIVIYALLIITNSKSEDMSSIGAVMVMFLFSVYSLATFNYDEKTKADRYILTLPLTKKEIILSKYILCILSVILGSIVGLLLGVSIPYLTTKVLPDIEETLSFILGGFLAMSFMQSIQIPCIYKYGAEKGRTQIYLIMMFIALIIGILYYLVPNINLTFLNKYSYIIPIIIIILIILNYLISYKISLNIYSKKDV